METVDGGFVCVGNVDGASLMQIDALGNLQFTKTYSNVSLNCVVKTNDGYFFVGKEHDWAYVMKADSNLELLWDKTYSVTYTLRALKASSDNCYLLYSGNAYLMKIGSSGNIEWSNMYDGLSLSLIQTEDRGFAYIGIRSEGWVHYIWLVKIAPEPEGQQPSPTPEPPELFPTTFVVTSIITVAVVGAGLLVYFKKHKR